MSFDDPDMDRPDKDRGDDHPGRRAVAAMLDRAVDAHEIVDIDPETGEEIAPSPSDRSVQDGGADERALARPGGLPPDCPFQALGRNKEVYYFSNSDGQLVGLKVSEIKPNQIMGLLDGNTDWALANWKGQREALDGAKSRDCMIAACKKRGIFNPENRVRGRGAWKGAGKRLILHLGDEIWTQVEMDGGVSDLSGRAVPFSVTLSEPGMIDGHFYEADEALLRPWDQPVGPDEIRPLLDRIKTWEWAKPETSPRLLLGWIAMTFIGGALKWRPHCLLQGASGCGKSTLQELIGLVIGPGKVKVANASEAGLSSELRHQTLPVMFDEFEGSEDNRQVMAVLDLMRRASSGAKRLRGSQTHQSHSSTNQSPFLVGMVTPPPLKTTDLNRLVFLQLKPLPIGPGWDPDEVEWQTMGRKLFRRVLDQWPDFSERLAQYSHALRKRGHKSRGEDTIGTLLAMADLVLADDAPCGDTMERWTQGLGPDEMIEYEGVSTPFDACLTWLLQSYPKRWDKHFSYASVGDAVARWPNADAEERVRVKRALEMTGLTIWTDRKSGLDYLFIPNSHQALTDLFDGSDYKGAGGTVGSWSWVLRDGEGVRTRERTRISGQLSRGVAVPIDAILARSEEDDDD